MTEPKAIVVQTGSNNGRIWFPQAIRPIACFIVVMEHLGSGYPRFLQAQALHGHFNPSPKESIAIPWISIARVTDSHDFSIGAMSVALFFLVSGFVIPFSLRRSSVSEFTAKRVFRLYPTLAVCVLVAVFVTWLQSIFEGVAQPYSVQTVLMTMTLTATFFHHSFVDGVVWTLVVEELFYVSAALIVWRNLYGRRHALVALGAGFTLLTMIPSTPGTALTVLGFYVAFIPFVYVGTVIHHVFLGEWKMRDGLLVGGVLFGLFTVGMYFSHERWPATMYIRSCAVGVLVFVVIAWLSPRLRYSRVLDELSKITYPLYLLHFISGIILLHWFELKNISYLVALPITVGCAVAGATLVHCFVEEPAVKIGRRIANASRARREQRNNPAPPKRGGVALSPGKPEVT